MHDAAAAAAAADDEAGAVPRWSARIPLRLRDESCARTTDACAAAVDSLAMAGCAPMVGVGSGAEGGVASSLNVARRCDWRGFICRASAGSNEPGVPWLGEDAPSDGGDVCASGGVSDVPEEAAPEAAEAVEQGLERRDARWEGGPPSALFAAVAEGLAHTTMLLPLGMDMRLAIAPARRELDSGSSERPEEVGDSGPTAAAVKGSMGIGTGGEARPARGSAPSGGGRSASPPEGESGGVGCRGVPPPPPPPPPPRCAPKVLVPVPPRGAVCGDRGVGLMWAPAWPTAAAAETAPRLLVRTSGMEGSVARALDRGGATGAIGAGLDCGGREALVEARLGEKSDLSRFALDAVSGS